MIDRSKVRTFEDNQEKQPLREIRVVVFLCAGKINVKLRPGAAPALAWPAPIVGSRFVTTAAACAGGRFGTVKLRGGRSASLATWARKPSMAGASMSAIARSPHFFIQAKMQRRATSSEAKRNVGLNPVLYDRVVTAT
ncbi:hypothetical protein [Pseudoxanthomonas winnipegensis]|uniref:Uncharacterized protein n=1 Tax=Pseudoxanthomonas winnipegensis TaxID=2480810 RepID=A0A4Q8M2T2_9GAMM|nr:hypothetical protein [Pseudoxanthomonas winnipegensis]TAA38521.1 hypothetical protein EA655_16670 [Pseudoxanthomonas winnipegensis]